MKDDAAMIAAPDRWPMWPKLPLKRYLDDVTKEPLLRTDEAIVYAGDPTKVYPNSRPIDMQTGQLIGDPVAPITVYGGNVFDAGEPVGLGQYDSPEAMVADGWLVD